MTGAADCTREPGEDVGSYTITCAPGTLAAANYVFETGDTAELAIEPATLFVDAVADSKTYGEGDPASPLSSAASPSTRTPPTPG